MLARLKVPVVKGVYRLLKDNQFKILTTTSLPVSYTHLDVYKRQLHGLSCLAHGEAVQLAERGSLREVAAGINAASGELQRRDAALRKKDEARANWIAGISHDIRTPLSVILGYAGELQDDPALPPQEQEQAAVICRQGIRLRDLVSDLNLVSRLEYDMQPVSYTHLDVYKRQQ